MTARFSTPISATIATVLASALLGACSDSGAPATTDVLDTRSLLRLPDRVATPLIPVDNPLTAETIALGRHLFYDPRLSGNASQSCAGCHIQALAFSDGRRATIGTTSERLLRNSASLVNVAWSASLTWSHDGLSHIEDQLQIPLLADDPVELGINNDNIDEVLGRFEADPVYTPLFAAAFPDTTAPVTLPNVTRALAHFTRSLTSFDSPYDRHLQGDPTALDDRQRQGLDLFFSERLGCSNCHAGVNLTVSYRDAGTPTTAAQAPFFNNGLYNVGDDGGYPIEDQGLFDLTLDPDDRGRFRPQGLRNVAVSAPYMHDGSLPTLRDVISHYARGGQRIDAGPNAGDGSLSPLKSAFITGFSIADDETEALIAFLDALTDEQFLTDPRFADPFVIPGATGGAVAGQATQP